MKVSMDRTILQEHSFDESIDYFPLYLDFCKILLILVSFINDLLFFKLSIY